eukprot:GFYU01015485.1.p1 GENE.GFYU01015485.1~~GFYU01015485.1.p1  ORF type:complete len:367 (+),score=102.90 GFYU01015485.1:125-1225(+)
MSSGYQRMPPMGGMSGIVSPAMMPKRTFSTLADLSLFLGILFFTFKGKGRRTTAGFSVKTFWLRFLCVVCRYADIFIFPEAFQQVYDLSQVVAKEVARRSGEDSFSMINFYINVIITNVHAYNFTMKLFLISTAVCCLWVCMKRIVGQEEDGTMIDKDGNQIPGGHKNDSFPVAVILLTAVAGTATVLYMEHGRLDVDEIATYSTLRTLSYFLESMFMMPQLYQTHRDSQEKGRDFFVDMYIFCTACHYMFTVGYWYKEDTLMQFSSPHLLKRMSVYVFLVIYIPHFIVFILKRPYIPAGAFVFVSLLGSGGFLADPSQVFAAVSVVQISTIFTTILLGGVAQFFTLSFLVHALTQLHPQVVQAAA